MRAVLPLILSAAIGASTHAAPVPGALKTVGDWTVGCDNTNACQADALATDPVADGHLRLVVTREAGPAAPARLTVPLGNALKGTRLMLAIDGAAVATIIAPGGGGGLALPLAGALRDRLVAGRTATLSADRVAPSASASLAGISAALARIDEVQGRVGTVTALLRPGRRPATSVPLAPPLPVIGQPPVGTRTPRTMKVKQATRLLGDAATCANPSRALVAKAWRLDAGHSLATIDHPCGNGAYNAFTSVFVIDERKHVAPAAFDAPPGMTSLTGHQIVTGGWDAAARRLTSFARGRGLGDCGVSNTYAWDGARFRLVEQRALQPCRGATNWITTWRATVRP